MNPTHRNQDLVLALRAIACPALRFSHLTYGFHRTQGAAGGTTADSGRSDAWQRRPSSLELEITSVLPGPLTGGAADVVCAPSHQGSNEKGKPMTMIARELAEVKPDLNLSFLWLELTGRCGLACAHCYAGSSPSGSHGVMTGAEWRSVITQAAGLGVPMAQFIGGEPTLHPQFADLLTCAVQAGLAVEVYTNLIHVKDSWWDLFACPRVSLATSYYSDEPGQHDAITGRRGSHARTRANIAKAVRRGIPLRAGIITVRDGQRAAQAQAELEALGVTSIESDRLRHLGRAAGAGEPDVSQLCGHCGRGIAAVLPSGDVTPCVMARWLTAGNVRETPLADILSGPAMAAAIGVIPTRSGNACGPDLCRPDNDGDICPPPIKSATHATG